MIDQIIAADQVIRQGTKLPFDLFHTHFYRAFLIVSKDSVLEQDTWYYTNQKYNDENGITPQTIQKAVRELISTSIEKEEKRASAKDRVGKDPDLMNKKELGKEIDRLTKKMNQAATELNFELAAVLRDELFELKVKLRDYDK